MASEQHKELYRRFIEECFTGGNLALVDEIIIADAVDHQAPPGAAQGVEGVKQVISMFRAAFPDLQVTVDQMIAEGDTLAGRFTMSGTHQGEFMGIPPTGKRMEITGIDVVRFENGKMVEHWGNSDDLGMMQQLGLIPMPGGGQG
ncbi:MAG TPA: ester cyclase [Chloroflexia bacterium]|nr:ester cyclase [Chloroflexia bacterium]